MLLNDEADLTAANHTLGGMRLPLLRVLTLRNFSSHRQAGKDDDHNGG
jgi:hypothetical protein